MTIHPVDWFRRDPGGGTLHVRPEEAPTTPAADVSYYDPAADGYDPSKDPRCLWGWGGCGCAFGHGCFRPYHHRGRCWDAGAKPDSGSGKCHTSQRPKDWDDRGRAEANA